MVRHLMIMTWVCGITEERKYGLPCDDVCFFFSKLQKPSAFHWENTRKLHYGFSRATSLEITRSENILLSNQDACLSECGVRSINPSFHGQMSDFWVCSISLISIFFSPGCCVTICFWRALCGSEFRLLTGYAFPYQISECEANDIVTFMRAELSELKQTVKISPMVLEWDICQNKQ